MIRLTPQTLLTPEVKEIFTDATSGNAWTSRTLRWIIRTGVEGYIQISTPIHSGIRKSSTPDSSDSAGTRGTGTRIYIGATAPPCGLNLNPKIDDIRKSATPDLMNANQLDTSIDWQFTNNLVAPPIFTDLLWEKLSYSSIQDIYTHSRMKFAADTVNISAPQLVNLGLSTINTLDTGASIWTPATIFVRPTNVAHWSAPDHILEKLQRLETLWTQIQTMTIKMILKIGGKIRNWSVKRMQGFDILWTWLLFVWKCQTQKQ